MALSAQARQAIITDGFAFEYIAEVGSGFATKLGRALLITDGYLYRAFGEAMAGVTSLWDRHKHFINV